MEINKNKKLTIKGVVNSEGGEFGVCTIETSFCQTREIKLFMFMIDY